MNFFDYIGKTPTEFEAKYLDTKLVQRARHHEFPLDLYTYTRECIKQDHWDGVTTKTRGVVVNRITGEIISRPFEKFFNYGQVEGERIPAGIAFHKPVFWEKVDGFLCTYYEWEGKPYIASKGSFHSIHAKWASAEVQKHANNWPAGYTPVFEGLHPDLRIVVDYGDRCELVLLALINNETGEEIPPAEMMIAASQNGYKTPNTDDLSLDRALDLMHETYSDGLGTDEGFVLTWYRKGKTPFRLKLKYDEYVRLHRIVTGVSAKRVWEALSRGDEATLKEWLEGTTPWFAKFAKKWIKIFTLEYAKLEAEATETFKDTSIAISRQFADQLVKTGGIDFAVLRKVNVEMYKALQKQPESIRPILFAMLDKDEVPPVIWKIVGRKATGISPLVDPYTT